VVKTEDSLSKNPENSAYVNELLAKVASLEGQLARQEAAHARHVALLTEELNEKRRQRVSLELQLESLRERLGLGPQEV